MSDEKNKKEKAIDKSRNYMCSVVNAAYTIDSLHERTLDIVAIAEESCKSIQKLRKGDLSEIEMMLITQAQTLNVLFHRFLSCTADTEFIPHIELLSDIALRAQNQSRKTLLALAEIKHPRRTTFIKQQNNATNQQVNIGAKSENKKNPANELLEVSDGQRLDSREAFKTIAIDSQMEALEVGGGEN